MTQKEFTLEVVTPIFISGPDTTKSELRAPSIKGLLRWWWRALNGNLPITQLKDDEEKIFGSTNKKSSFSLIVQADQALKTGTDNLPSGKRIPVKSSRGNFSISIIDYLAYGIAEYVKGKGNVYNRPHIKPGNTFKLVLHFYNEEHKSKVINSLNALLTFGGIGAKSRNGFGSLHCEQLKENVALKKSDRAAYHAISKDSKLYLYNIHKSWVDALVEIGTCYRQARLNLEPKHIWDKRRLVATPIEVKGEISIPERHAKPFFLHVDKVENSYQGKILFMPYNYYQSEKENEYNDVMKKMCDYLEANAREVTDAF